MKKPVLTPLILSTHTLPQRDSKKIYASNTLEIKTEKVKKILLKSLRQIENRKPGEEITILGGKHCTAFKHTRFPGFIFKKQTHLESLEERKKNIDTARNIINQYKLHLCHVPAAAVLKLDDKNFVLVMEKAEGFIQIGSCLEASELDFEKFSSCPKIKKKWSEFVEQAGTLICKTGYWDASWSNIGILPNDKGLVFFDFEQASPTKFNQVGGLDRLFDMAHPDHHEIIINIIKEHQLLKIFSEDAYNKDFKKAKEKRINELKLFSTVRAWHKEKKITSQEQLVKDKYKSSTVGHIIKGLNKELKDPYLHYYKGSLARERHWHGQPLLERIRGEKIMRKEYEKALNFLVEEDVICCWKNNAEYFEKYNKLSEDEELLGYDIYY